MEELQEMMKSMQQTMQQQQQTMQSLQGSLEEMKHSFHDMSRNAVTKEYLDSKIDTVTQQVTRNTSAITELGHHHVTLAQKVDDNHNDVLSGMNSEIDMRLKKQNNLAVFGMTESAKSTPEERKEDDKKRIDDLINDILPTTEKVAPKTLFRPGKPQPGKARPVVVVLNNQHDKAKIFKHKKALKGNTRWKNVSIKPDRTKLQMHYDKIRDNEKEQQARKQNLEMEKSEYDDGHRWVVQGPSGFRRLKKVKLSLTEIFNEQTLQQTFGGFGSESVLVNPGNLQLGHTMGRKSND